MTKKDAALWFACLFALSLTVNVLLCLSLNEAHIRLTFAHSRISTLNVAYDHLLTQDLSK